LHTEEPLEACYYCLGSSGRRFPHRVMKRGESDEETGDYCRELEAAAAIAFHNGDSAFALRCYLSAKSEQPSTLKT